MGRIVHFEMPSDKPEELLEFYKTVFGWSGQKWGANDYWLLDTGNTRNPAINGAISKKNEQLQCVVNTINVDDIAKSISLVGTNGGTVLTEIMDIPKVGKIAYFKDPEGNTFGLIEDVET